MKEFKFTYLMGKNKIILDDQSMIVKRGIFYFYQKQFLLSDLNHFYTNKVSYGEKGDAYNYLILAYTGRDGQTKSIKLHAGVTDSIFLSLVAELQSNFPAKSLNHLPEEEALKMLKTTNWKRIGPLVGSSFVMALALIYFIPELGHYLDFGFAQTNVRDLGNHKDLGTRNIGVGGKLLHKTIATESKGRYRDYFLQYIPLVADDWKEGDSIKVVLRFSTPEENTSVMDREEYIGVIRDIAWEGEGNVQVAELKDNPALRLAEHPVLVEVTWRKRNDAQVRWMLGGFFILSVIVFFRMKKRTKANG